LAWYFFWQKTIGAKAAHKMLVKIDPWCQFHQHLTSINCNCSLNVGEINKWLGYTHLDPTGRDQFLNGGEKKVLCRQENFLSKFILFFVDRNL